MKVLVKFDRDWADEFSVYGFIVCEQERWNEIVLDIDKIYFNFGTNEGFEAGDITEIDFNVTEITEDEAAVIIKLFGKEWGIFPVSNGEDDD